MCLLTATEYWLRHCLTPPHSATILVQWKCSKEMFVWFSWLWDYRSPNSKKGTFHGIQCCEGKKTTKLFDCRGEEECFFPRKRFFRALKTYQTPYWKDWNPVMMSEWLIGTCLNQYYTGMHNYWSYLKLKPQGRTLLNKALFLFFTLLPDFLIEVLEAGNLAWLVKIVRAKTLTLIVILA